MEKILATLIQEFRGQLPSAEESVKRDFKFPDVPDLIRVAIGIRRCGKTYLMYQKIRELIEVGVPLDQILFLNFEDDRLLPMDQKTLGKLLDTFYQLYPENHDRQCYLFLDEIQNVEGWQRVVRRFYDSKKVQIFLTGSSAKLLSKEIATSLRGRSISSEIWPYDFGEYCIAHGISYPSPPHGKKNLDLFYKHYCRFLSVGGFPAVQHLHDNERRTVLQSYVEAVVFRDIVERYKISNIQVIKYLIKTLIKNVATPFSVSKFYHDLKSQGVKVGKDTIYQYLEYLEDAFLAFRVPIFSESLRKSQLNPKKIYIADNGLVTSGRLGISLKLGNLFENQVYLDLRRKGKQVYYYKTQEGFEIDFVVKDQEGHFEMQQIVWDISDERTLEREERALKSAEKELGIKGKLITPQEKILEFLND